jgi:hypothetical protein
MAAANQLTIQITGDDSDLKKALSDVTKEVQKFGANAESLGKKGGAGFGTGFVDGTRGKLKLVAEQFDGIRGAAEGGFAGLARSFITLALNPITLALATLATAIFGAFQFARIGEENQRIANSFKQFATDAGLDANRLKERISGIAEGFVDLEDVLPRAGQAVLALGKNANQLPEIFALARNIGVQTGKDINQVFDELTKGIENQNIKLLRANGIRLDADKILSDFAKTNGVLVSQLSEAAKQQAFLNATLEQGAKKFGEVGSEATPIQGGIKKIGLAFDDLKDAIAGVVNSRLGEWFASVLTGAASATKAVAEFFTPEKTGPLTIAEQIDQVQKKIASLNESKLTSPAFAEGYNRELDVANEKLRALQTIQAAVDKANADRAQLTREEIVAGESDEQIQARLEKERQKNADLALIQADANAVELQAKLDHEMALAVIENDGLTNTQTLREAQFQATLARNEAEFQATVAKNAKIEDNEKMVSANLAALRKKDLADQKAIDAQKMADAKAVADAKLLIENNLFSAAKLLVDQQSALGKTLAVAEAIRNTYRGATLALATYPPPFGAAAAASTVALGLAQVAKITAANSGALVTTGQPGQDTNPFLLSRGEIVAPAKSFDEVVEGTARQRGFVKANESTETNSLLKQLIDKIDARSVSVTVNTDVVADQNGINLLVERIRDAIDFNAAPSLG